MVQASLCLKVGNFVGRENVDVEVCCFGGQVSFDVKISIFSGQGELECEVIECCFQEVLVLSPRNVHVMLIAMFCLLCTHVMSVMECV